MTPRVARQRGWRHRGGDALRHGSLVFMLLALLPAASSLRPPLPACTAAILLAAIAAWLWMIAGGQAPPSGIALLEEGNRHGRLGTWELSLLAFSLAVCAAYVVVALRFKRITFNDGAYYYGVARHMARTGRFEEPIVWHFLHLPDSIVHAPFDYWGPATSLLLVPSMLVFGATFRTAFVTMSVISSAALLAFWYLVCRALPLRYRVTQLLALVIFAFSPAMDVYRFQPESIAIAQLFLLLALIAFCHRRSAVALLCGFGIVLARSDGSILFGLISVACLLREWQPVAGRARRVGRVVLAGLACVGAYSVWSLASFGTLTPPGARLVPFLPSYWRVFDFVAPEQRPLTPLSLRFTSAYVVQQMERAFRILRGTPFTPAGDWWLILALVPALRQFRRRPPAEPLIWVLGIGGYFLMAWTSGPGFAAVRAPYTFVPLVILAGALGIDAIASALDAWMRRDRSPRWAPTVVGAALLTVCSVLLIRLPVLRGTANLSNLGRQMQLTKLEEVLNGEPVASNVPWYLIAFTDSPTVSIPFNGPEAIEAMLTRYPVQWMVVRPGFGARSVPFLDGLLSGANDRLGRFRFERVPVDGLFLGVFRVRSDE
jgi:hypothetical protein